VAQTYFKGKTKMNKDLFFISNWKMNLSLNEEFNFASKHYDTLITLSKKKHTTIILCPSYVSLYTLAKIFKDTKIHIGAQDCSKHSKGSFTSQICAQSIHQLGCTYCIVGHSETRTEHTYTTHDIVEKCQQLINYTISPIICIGENAQEYKEEKTIQKLDTALLPIFNIINKEAIIPQYLNICIAYEPIWAIGTGNTPTQDTLEIIFAYLHEKTQKTCPHINWKLLYGGSVSAENIQTLKKIHHLDGFLIGSASLDIQELEKIVQLY
jgi:triosephosphate isomerase